MTMRQFHKYLETIGEVFGIDCRILALSSPLGFPPELITTQKEALTFVNWKLKSLSMGVKHERSVRGPAS